MRHAPSPFAGSRSDYGRPESRKSDPWQSISASNTIDHAKLKNRAFQCVKDFTIGLLVSQTVESVRQRYTLCSVMPSCLTNRARVWPFPCRTSASLSLRMIISGVYRFPAVIRCACQSRRLA